VIQIDLFEDLS